ncbi:MAG: type II toxin-antitoxin system prevent-host-death family antitoxin, partial [Chloroflexi bacterium]|nr:type II toxin-antitoxin system prevent-host-death family antitoxin [Chloroflexota bacterium]
MAELTVGVRELKSQLSKYLRQVKAGRTVVITEHGKVGAQLGPGSQSVEEKMKAMVKAGLAEWDGKKLKPMKPIARV